MSNYDKYYQDALASFDGVAYNNPLLQQSGDNTNQDATNDDHGFFSTAGNLFASGFAGGIESDLETAQQLGADGDFIKKAKQTFGEISDKAISHLSPELVSAMNKKASDGVFDSDWWAGNLGQLIGTVASMMVTGFGVGTGVKLGAKVVAKGLGKTLAEKAVAKGLNKRAAETIGAMTANLVMSGGDRAKQARQDILSLDDKALDQANGFSEEYWSLADQGEITDISELRKKAKENLAEKAASKAFANKKSITADLIAGGAGGYLGGYKSPLSKIVNPPASLKGRALMGATKEATTEALQEGTAQLASNEAAIELGVKKDRFDNVGEAALAGGLLGAPSGALGGLMDRPSNLTKNETTPEPTKPMKDAPKTGVDSIDQVLQATTNTVNEMSVDKQKQPVSSTVNYDIPPSLRPETPTADQANAQEEPVSSPQREQVLTPTVIIKKYQQEKALRANNQGTMDDVTFQQLELQAMSAANGDFESLGIGKPEEDTKQNDTRINTGNNSPLKERDLSVPTIARNKGVKDALGVSHLFDDKGTQLPVTSTKAREVDQDLTDQIMTDFNQGIIKKDYLPIVINAIAEKGNDYQKIRRSINESRAIEDEQAYREQTLPMARKITEQAKAKARQEKLQSDWNDAEQARFRGAELDTAQAELAKKAEQEQQVRDANHDHIAKYRGRDVNADTEKAYQQKEQQAQEQQAPTSNIRTLANKLTQNRSLKNYAKKVKKALKHKKASVKLQYRINKALHEVDNPSAETINLKNYTPNSAFADAFDQAKTPEQQQTIATIDTAVTPVIDKLPTDKAKTEQENIINETLSEVLINDGIDKPSLTGESDNVSVEQTRQDINSQPDVKTTGNNEELSQLKDIAFKTMAEQGGKLKGVRTRYAKAKLNPNKIAQDNGYEDINALEKELRQEFKQKKVTNITDKTENLPLSDNKEVDAKDINSFDEVLNGGDIVEGKLDTSNDDHVTGKTLADHLYHEVSANRIPKNAIQLKQQVAKHHGIDPKDVTKLQEKQGQEHLESALVKQARDHANSGDNSKNITDKLITLYENQPNLNIKTAKSSKNMAFSTPAPISYLANLVAGISRNDKVYEPTAGNGLLLMTNNINNTTVNEIDTERGDNLTWLGYKNVTNKDALVHGIVADKSQDVVIMNPPFGFTPKPLTVKGNDGLEYTLKDADHVIAAQQLEAMKDDGNAVLILGANKQAGVTQGGKTGVFLNWLYNNYNVVDHVELDGKVYSRQGAEWPIRIITIHGRNNTDTNYAPSNGTVDRLSGANARQIIEGLYERYQQNGLLDAEHGKPRRQTEINTSDRTRSENRDNTTSDQSGRVEQDLQPDRGNATERATVDDGNGRPTNAKRNGDGTSSDSGRANERTSGSDRSAQHSERKPAMEKQDISHRQERSSTNGRTGRDTNDTIRHLKKVKPVNDFQAQYIPASSGFNDNVLIPVNMAGKIQKALTKLIKAVGNVDEYVADKLGYDSINSVHDAFMALQVDAVAMAIHKAEQGKAIIIADQTGVGKGRQAAALMRYALRQGKIPVFLSQKANLFSDIYENLADIDTHDIKPFIFNKDEGITHNNKTLFKLSDKVRKKHLANLTKGKLPENTNAVFLTYSQIQRPNDQQKALSAIADNAFFILDEAHTGAGNTAKVGDYIKETLKNAAGTLYLSATYAKRPDQLALYYKTSLGQAVGNMDELSEAISNGGLQLQTLLSSMLSEEGELIRRERSFDGISINTKVDTNNSAEHEQSFDKVTGILQKIIQLNKAFVRYTKAENKKSKGGTTLTSTGTVDKMNPLLFSSVVHNYIAQLTMAIKSESAANEAIKAIKAGKKPVIALESTLESKLDNFMANNHKAIGDSVSGFGFADILYNAVDNALSLTEKLPNGKTRKTPLNTSDLPSGIVAMKRDIEKLIANTELDAPISPIDTIRKMITDAGYSVEEVTGRSKMVDYDDNMTVINKPTAENKANRRKVIDRFNNGKKDVLILNQAGSTGLSIHASETFGDKRRRHMIVAQPSLDINTFMQMLGRINRTGQVELPSYDILWLDLPSENRPATVLSNKMKGLNAQTSANTDSANDIDSMDLFNPYGDDVVSFYLEEHPELLVDLGIGMPKEDIAQTITGKLAVLPVSKQREFFDEVEPRYKEYVDYLKSIGEYSLETKEVDLDAKPIEQNILHKGEGNSVFDSDIKLTKSDVKKQGRSPSLEDFKAAIDNVDTQKIPTALDDLNSKFDTYIANKYDKAISNAKDADSLKSLQNKKSKEESAKYITEQELRYKFKLGSSIIISIDEKINGLIADIKIKPSKKGSPYAKSNFVYTILTASGLNKLTLTYSQLEKITETTGNLSQSYLGKIFKAEHDKPLRENRYIITGNLIKAFSMIKGGKVVSFTQHDGSNNIGILLPKDFKKDNDISKSHYVTSFDKGLNYLKETNDAILQGQGIKNSDNFTINMIKGELSVGIPVNTKEIREKYLTDDMQAILDEELAWRKGQKIVYASINPEQGRQLFDLVKKINPLSVTDSAVDEYNRINNIKDQSKEVNTKDIAFSKTAPTTIMADSVPKKHLTLEQTNKVVQDFINDYKGNFPLNFEVVNDQAEVYKENGTVEKIGLIKGAYHAQSRKVVITAMGMQTVADGRETLRHELLGHYGLNTFKPEDKKAILQRVINSKNRADLKPHWDRANKDYDGASELEKAEEVFAFIAEKPPVKTAFWHGLVSLMRKALRAIGIGKDSISKREIQSLIKTISDQIKSGKAKQQTTPKNNQSQFRKNNTQTFDEVISQGEEGIFAKAKQVLFENKFSEAVKRQALGALSLSQLGDVGQRILPQINRYIDVVRQMLTKRNIMAEKSAEIANDFESWAAKNQGEADNLVDVMHDATLAMADPSETFKEGTHLIKERLKVLDHLLRARSGEANSGRKLELNKEVKALTKELYLEPKRKADHARLKPKWDALTPEAQAFYKKIRDSYKANNDQFKAVMIARIENSAMSGHEKKEQLERLRYEFEKQNIQAPYFPLSRFGKYWVSTTTPEGEQVYMMQETEGEQKRIIKNLKKAYGNDHEVKSGLVQDKSAETDGATMPFIKGLIDKVETADLGEKQAGEIKDSIYQLYLENLPSRSMRKQFIHRKGIAGYSKNAVRGFADNMIKQAYQLSRLEHSDQLNELMLDMKKTSSSDNTATRFYNEMLKRHDWTMNPTNSAITSKISGLGFVYMLGLSPAAALVNTTQNMVIGLPVLKAHFKNGSPVKELLKATKEFMTSKDDQGRISIKGKLLGDELEAYNQWRDSGLIDTTNSHDLAGIAENGGFNYSNITHKAMNVVSALFHKAEVYNRETMAIAAYRLARKNGMDHNSAVKKAADLTWYVHFDYANVNRARFMQGDFMKVATQFKQYSQNMTYFLFSNLNTWARGKNKDEVRIARTQLLGTLGMTALLGGVAALPIATLYAIANTLKFDDDDPWDAETEFTQFLVNLLGKEGADLILHGAGGSGLTGRISLNSLWVRTPDRDLEGRDLWNHYAQQAVGPVFGGIVPSVLEGMRKIREGKIERGFENMLPKAFRDIAKTGRYANEGAQTLSGVDIKGKEDFTPLQLFMQAIGFSDSEVNNQYQQNNAIKGYEQHITSRRSELMSKYYLAFKDGDQKDKANVLKSIARFNRINPEVSISSKTLRRSIKARIRSKARMKNGVYINKNLSYLRDRYE